MKTYKVVNGTSYDARTPDQVIGILEKARLERIRLHVSLGYTDGPSVGLDWLEEFDSHGYIGRSTGSIKVPLLIATSRSTGGGALLDPLRRPHSDKRKRKGSVSERSLPPRESGNSVKVRFCATGR